MLQENSQRCLLFGHGLLLDVNTIIFCFSAVADPDSNPDPNQSDPYVFGLLDPDPLIRGMDLDPSITKQK